MKNPIAGRMARVSRMRARLSTAARVHETCRSSNLASNSARFSTVRTHEGHPWRPTAAFSCRAVREREDPAPHTARTDLTSQGEWSSAADGEMIASSAVSRLCNGAAPYSFTLHAPGGTRLVGFDNAHDVPVKGSRFKRRGETTDYWHRTEDDPGRPYRFKDAETLIEDFFDEVERVLRDRGVGLEVTRTESSQRSK